MNSRQVKTAQNKNTKTKFRNYDPYNERLYDKWINKRSSNHVV